MISTDMQSITSPSPDIIEIPERSEAEILPRISWVIP